MFVMVFLVETINIFCDGFIYLFIYLFSVGHKPIGAYQLYSGIVAAVSHMTSMRAPTPFTRAPLKNNVHDAPDTTIQNYLSNKWNMMRYVI